MEEKKVYVEPVSDQDGAKRFLKAVYSWRQLVEGHGYTGPVLWHVRAGFDFEIHVPDTGPGYESYDHLPPSVLGGEATKESFAFWVPRLVTGSRNLSPEEQLALLAKLRQKFGLPEHHLASFGNASVLSALMLAYFEHFKENAPPNSEWARTDSFDLRNRQLLFSGFGNGQLRCDFLQFDGNRRPLVGCFPLGVELAA